MKYEWSTVGQQDNCIHYRCYLGPIMLNLEEDYWEDEDLFMQGAVYRWNSLTREWDDGKEIFVTKAIGSWQPHLKGDLEDWYATNVLIEDMLGVSNVVSK